MIHIIIFAIFMSIFHTDAAEGPDNRVWFTGETVASNCRALKDNLEHCGLVVAESALFQVFAALSQRDFFQNASPVLQVDVEVLLHVLRKESETCPYQLAQRFYHNHCDAIYSQIILHLGQCVPKIDIYDEDIQKILACFPKVLKRDAIKANIERRYQKQNSERLSPSLKHALFTMFLESEYKGLEHDKHFVEVLSWLKGESAQTYYGTLTANLARQRFAVECSPMLEVCGALSQSDFFQKVDLWLKVDINILLHFLCEESGKNPEKLASSFREKDSQVREMKEGEKTILYVFGQCVSEVQTDDLKRMLKCLPKILGQRSFIKRRILRRYQKVGAERFSEELQNTLFKWKMTAESDHQDPESTHQGRPSDAGAVSSASDEERPWLKEKSAQEHCGMLEAQLRQKAMTVENSSMLFLCRELSRHDCDLDTNFLVRTDIKTVLYLLCQKSLCQKIEMPSDEL
ncbi:MAG: hypothetical protein OXC30_02330, partial [Alphaproteobacteria bacterium]|nr:hypothetical protein [Alphaproteobacteria bacterium]